MSLARTPETCAPLPPLGSKAAAVRGAEADAGGWLCCWPGTRRLLLLLSHLAPLLPRPDAAPSWKTPLPASLDPLSGSPLSAPGCLPAQVLLRALVVRPHTGSADGLGCRGKSLEGSELRERSRLHVTEANVNHLGQKRTWEFTPGAELAAPHTCSLPLC